MDDLISRQKLLNDVEELRQSPWFNDDNYFAIRKDALSCVVDLCIKKAPSVDAVEVVRCKNCKHRQVNEHYGEDGYLSIKAMCALDTGDVFELGRNAWDDDWFCADGERKTDG